MKKTSIAFLLLLLASIASAQDTINKEIETGFEIEEYEPANSKFNIENEFYSDAKYALSIGLLEGGGGLVGADIEALFLKKMGVQVGVGWNSFEVGINYHFRPNIKSAFFSVQYWNQLNYASYIGPLIVFRGKRWLTAQVGLGFILSKGPLFNDIKMFEDISTVMLYSIGAYFPL